MAGTTFSPLAKGENVSLFVPIPGTESADFIPGCILERSSESFKSKVCLTASPVKKTETGGFWVEIKLLSGTLVGYANGIALGFTATSPDTLPEIPVPDDAEEGTEPKREVPQFAYQLPDSYVIGYKKALYWNGERNEVDIDTAQLAPLDSDRIGVHLAPDGTMELYVNRIKRGTIPLPEGATAPSADALYAVIDLVGQACLVQLVDSYPPEEETDEMRKAQVKRDLRRTFKSKFGEAPPKEDA